MCHGHDSTDHDIQNQKLEKVGPVLITGRASSFTTSLALLASGKGHPKSKADNIYDSKSNIVIFYSLISVTYRCDMIKYVFWVSHLNTVGDEWRFPKCEEKSN